MALAGASRSGVVSVPRRAPVAEQEISVRVRRGLVAGAVAREFFPRSPAVAVGTYDQATPWTQVTSSPIGETGGMFPLAADGPVQVVSSSAADTSAGTGAQFFRVIGLGPGGEPVTSGPSPPYQTEVLALNGLTPVPGVSNFYGGVSECGGVVSAGTSLANVGSLTVSRVSDGRVLYVIPPTWGHTRSDYSFVPNGWTAIIRDLVVFWNGDTQCQWRLRVHSPLGYRQSLLGGSISRENSGSAIDLHGGYEVPALHSFWWEAVRDVGGVGGSAFMSIFAVVEYYLANDTVI